MNRVVHFEIYAKDLDKMQKFYQAAFGWDITDMGEQMGNYRMVKTGESKPGEMWPGINGGITTREDDQMPKDGAAHNAFVCTIDVPDIDEALKKVETAGGTMTVEKVDIPGVGILAYCKDPEGNIFGVMQAAE